MADKKFGQKRICTNCETKFYDLNKKSPFNCPHCKTEITIEDDILGIQNSSNFQQDKKSDPKDDELLRVDNDNGDDEIISLDDAAIEEEQEANN